VRTAAALLASSGIPSRRVTRIVWLAAVLLTSTSSARAATVSCAGSHPRTLAVVARTTARDLPRLTDGRASRCRVAHAAVAAIRHAFKQTGTLPARVRVAQASWSAGAWAVRYAETDVAGVRYIAARASRGTRTIATQLIDLPRGSPPPASLTTTDLRVGRGRLVRRHDRLVTHFIGFAWSTATFLDSSRDRGQSFEFRLGAGQVIRGWDEGLVGMRTGGRRLLILPPRFAYGDAGNPPAIKPGETLVFVVDALSRPSSGRR
jgi:peptidylprolyl isomerase